MTRRVSDQEKQKADPTMEDNAEMLRLSPEKDQAQPGVE